MNRLIRTVLVRFRCAGLAVLLLGPGLALAAYDCSVSPGGITLSYQNGSATQVSGTSSVTITCSRASGDAATRYVELGLTYSANASGTQPRLLGGTASYLNYSLWRTSTFSGSNGWTSANNRRLAATLNFGTSLSTSTTVTYWMTMPAGQAATAGNYSDTMTLTLWESASASPSSGFTQTTARTTSFTTAAVIPNLCTISSAPGNISLAYTSFQTTAATASTSFAVRCAINTSYTMALDATSGTLVGLNYGLALSNTGTIVGTGLPQSASITATIAAGQSGTCNASNGSTCSATATRTLTITY